ncbi:peptidase dimerization domain-containing protein [Escherichia coli]
MVGNNVHPGTAKGVMVNALSLAARIHAEVPADESPEMTEGYEGFYHLASMKGTVDRADMHYIIRDFDRKQFEARKRKMMEIAKKVGKGLHPDCYIELVIEDSYYNMREKVVEHPHIIDIAQQAIVTAILNRNRSAAVPTARSCSFMGLPCPNLFTGGYNYHGKHEFVTLEGMEKAVQVIVRIAELTAQRKPVIARCVCGLPITGMKPLY